MEAAERIFDGSFDHVGDEDEDVEMAPAREKPKASRMIVSLVRILYHRNTHTTKTPEGDDDDDNELEDAGEDYDEDDGMTLISMV